MLYIALDFESAGGTISKHGFTQLGAKIYTEDRKEIAEFNQYSNMKGFTWSDKRCMEEFWEKNPVRLADTKKGCGLSDYTCAQVVANYLDWVRFHTKGVEAHMVSDNCTYDAAILRAFADEDVLYSILAVDGTEDYHRIEDLHSIYRGVVMGLTGANPITLESPKKKAMAALGITSIPNWGVSHDHHPANDAAKMLLDFLYIMQCARENQAPPPLEEAA